MQKLNIAILSYRSAPFGGGQGIYVHDISKALSLMGHQVDVISGPPYPNLDEKVNLIKLGTRSATSEGRIFNLEGKLVATLMHTAQPVDVS